MKGFHARDPPLSHADDARIMISEDTSTQEQKERLS